MKVSNGDLNIPPLHPKGDGSFIFFLQQVWPTPFTVAEFFLMSLDLFCWDLYDGNDVIIIGASIWLQSFFFSPSLFTNYNER